MTGTKGKLLFFAFFVSVILNLAIHHFYTSEFFASSPVEIIVQTKEASAVTSSQEYLSSSSSFNAFGVPPEGAAPNLPSLEVVEEDEKVTWIRKRHGYGGQGDQKHLGGFTDIDPDGISPALWADMMEYFGVKSILDVGCGRSFSTTWFHMQGVKAQCVEGSNDALQKNLLLKLVSNETKGDENLMKKYFVPHDFARGPWWPEQTVDALWSVEFLEHVGRNYQENYLPAFKKAAFLFVTHSEWGGWHHTEVHATDWWINRLEMYGFRYSDSLTKRARGKAVDERKKGIPFPVPVGKKNKYNGFHLSRTLMVFINPAVASLPQHAHLLAEGGCYDDSNVHCGDEKNVNSKIVNTPLPDDFRPIPFKEDKHIEWEEFIKENVLKAE